MPSSTVCRRLAMRASSSASLVSTRSARLSSTSRMSIGLACSRGVMLPSSLAALGRQLDVVDPELLQRAQHLDELLVVDRLGDVAVGMQVVRTVDVLLRLRGGEDDHRD